MPQEDNFMEDGRQNGSSKMDAIAGRRMDRKSENKIELPIDKNR